MTEERIRELIEKDALSSVRPDFAGLRERINADNGRSTAPVPLKTTKRPVYRTIIAAAAALLLLLAASALLYVSLSGGGSMATSEYYDAEMSREPSSAVGDSLEVAESADSENRGFDENKPEAGVVSPSDVSDSDVSDSDVSASDVSGEDAAAPGGAS